MSDGGKGSGRRPIHVPKDQFNANWDAIFGKTPRNREEALDMLTQEAQRMGFYDAYEQVVQDERKAKEL